MTKAELEAKIEELEAQLKESDTLAGFPMINKQTDGSVAVYAGVFTADEWIEAVAKVSVGGANGTNLAVARKLHLG